MGDPMDPETTLAPLSSAEAKKDVLAQIKLALDHGATAVYGNVPIDHLGNFVHPTILTNISKDNPIYNTQHQTAALHPPRLNSEEEAIELANDSSYGLYSFQ